MTTAPIARGYFVGDYEGLGHQDESFLPFFVMTNSGNLSNRTDVFAPLSDEAGDRGNSHEEINAARDTTKTNTYRVETFRSPELGYLGYVDADKVSFYRTSTKRHSVNSEFDVSQIKTLPKVDILYSYVEPNSAMIHALITSGVNGIVFAGTGAGTLSSIEKTAVKEVLSLPAASRPVLVRSSRTGNGRVVGREEYDEMGMIPADTLNPQKARILLMLALTKTNNLEQIKRMFAEY